MRWRAKRSLEDVGGGLEENTTGRYGNGCGYLFFGFGGGDGGGGGDGEEKEEEEDDMEFEKHFFWRGN